MYFSRAWNQSLVPPDWVSLNLTMKCNLACTMCTTCYDAPGELDTDEIKSVIDQTAQWGVKVLNPLGGEPFVRKDLEDILAYACKKDFTITVTTNGTLITKKRAEALARIPPSRLHFNISLDGPEAIHDAIRGDGQYQRALQGYRHLRAADAAAGNQHRKILVNTLIHNRNLAELPDFLDEQEALGFDGVQLLNLFRHGKSDGDDPGGLWIQPEQIEALEALVERLVARVNRQAASGYRILNPVEDLGLIPSYYRDALTPLDAPCWSGWKELYIHSDGSAIMCDGELEFLEGRFGNVQPGVEGPPRGGEVLHHALHAGLLSAPGIRFHHPPGQASPRGGTRWLSGPRVSPRNAGNGAGGSGNPDPRAVRLCPLAYGGRFGAPAAV